MLRRILQILLLPVLFFVLVVLLCALLFYYTVTGDIPAWKNTKIYEFLRRLK